MPMDPHLPGMLPKGIVTNTGTIYTEVAAYPTVPADKVWQYWHVYTTTNKKLKDPTARRLENFWWHVWGSDRRFLSGQALARLYENISLGPTIAPLQGPANRWEGPNVPAVTRQLIVAHLSQIQASQFQTSQSHTSQSHTSQLQTSQPQATQHPTRAQANGAPPEKTAPSHASRSTPNIVIDKPPKASSSTGSKPTVRFATPPESPRTEDKGDDKESDGHSSDGTGAAGLEMPVKTPNKKRPPSLPAKKFVAPSAASRRRPALHRRSSPQSPTSAVPASRHDELSERHSEPRAVSPILEAASIQVAAAPKSSGAGNGKMLHPASSKMLGKRPAMSRRAASEKHELSIGRSAPFSSARGQPSPRRSKPPPLPRVQSMVHGATPAVAPTPALAPTPAVAPRPAVLSPPPLQPAPVAPPMIRSQSHGAYGPVSTSRRHDRSPSQGLFTTATASMSNVAAQGTIIDQAGSLPASTALEPLPGEPWLPTSKPLKSPLLEARLTPTQPSPSASVPMGRTRSQLTLLLEREKARIGDRARSRS